MQFATYGLTCRRVDPELMAGFAEIAVGHSVGPAYSSNDENHTFNV